MRIKNMPFKRPQIADFLRSLDISVTYSRTNKYTT